MRGFRGKNASFLQSAGSSASRLSYGYQRGEGWYKRNRGLHDRRKNRRNLYLHDALRCCDTGRGCLLLQLRIRPGRLFLRRSQQFRQRRRQPLLASELKKGPLRKFLLRGPFSNFLYRFIFFWIRLIIFYCIIYCRFTWAWTSSGSITIFTIRVI